MPDFFSIVSDTVGKRQIVRPEFKIGKSKDLMIRGGDFYAVWDEQAGFWSTDEETVKDIIDASLKESAVKSHCEPALFENASSGTVDKWIKYVKSQSRDNFKQLDSKLVFKDAPVNKTDYATKCLPYALTEGPCECWDKLLHTLYSTGEAHKIEWCIGAIVSGDSRTMQKFLVFYGEAGSGKSTIINVIEKLFVGYTGSFNASDLGNRNASFALEPFAKNPLVAIQHDGDLSKIEDNTRLNSLISHEYMSVNQKFKNLYETKFDSFLIIGTNTPVKITDSKSGLLRRLIDVRPSGNKIEHKEYNRLMQGIDFELGMIANKCLNIYLDDPNYYDEYIPVQMMGASNDFFNFMLENYAYFKQNNGITLTQAWKMYKQYNEECNIPYPLKKPKFKEELKPYFLQYIRKGVAGATDDKYIGINESKFIEIDEEEKIVIDDAAMKFTDSISDFDILAADYPAQVANANGTPMYSWDNCKTTLKDIDTSLLHYVRVPENHIVIDFDIPDPVTGEKSFKLNAEAASKWPKTYAELSKSGAGIHLHYIYNGDASKLSRIYDDHIELKVYTGKSSLRRKLSKCINNPIATISSGLPLKEESKKMINKDVLTTEKGLRTTIKRCLLKEIHPNTRCNVDFIYKVLEDAYNNGTIYDVTDLKSDVIAFAAQSSHQADYCLKLCAKMHFKSETVNDNLANDEEQPLVFFDIEVFPNLLLVNWKYPGPDATMVRMINPTAEEVENLINNNRLVGFNNRRYDNHILYARTLGYSNKEMYDLSYRIVNSHKGEVGVLFREAYNLSYTDIYDFAAKKQSLKKWEIELGLHHQELGLPWNEPVPESRWAEVAEYCDNDVISTEAVWNHLQPDWNARQILASVAGLTVNDTTNTLTTKIILGNDTKTAKQQFNWRDMSDESDVIPWAEELGDPKWTNFNTKGQPIFVGYKFYNGKSTYRDEEVGEGGYVYATTGIWRDVALLDIASMHPASIIAEDLFGPYTTRFRDIRDARVAIKHSDWESARTMLGGALAPYVADEETAAAQADNLSQALKIAINSVYGLTAASFDHPMHDNRNIDNIVAKRGALFMINLKHEVQKRGFTVAHIKTDSIKIPNATPEIIKFVTDYGKMYGYTFEHEATYEKMCLVNDAVYIAKYASVEHCYDLYGADYVNSAPEVCKKNKKKAGHWDATGTQFQVPYVYKTLFSHEPIDISDLAQTKEVKTAIYLKYDDDLRFIGKVGSFCPVTENGADLVRENVAKDGTVKYDSVTGAKGYKWIETEELIAGHMEDKIDKTFYKAMVDAAVETIAQYGDIETFID